MKQDTPAVHSAARRRLSPRLFVILGLLGGVGVVAVWSIMPRTVTVAYPEYGQAIQAVYATGTIEASITIRVAPQIAGRLIELNADEGQSVKSTDILGRFDDRDLRAAVAELEARARYAEQQFQRTEALLKQGWVTRDKFDQARSEQDAARHAVRRATEQMSFMTLRTPADGQIIRRDGEVGDFIPTNQPVFYIAKDGVPLRVSADVDEEDIALVQAGQKVLMKADAFPGRIFEGHVSEVTPKGDPIARSYRVRVSLPKDTPLKIGMTAETNIITAVKEKALLVPASAVSGASLWAVREGKLLRLPVQLGIKGQNRVEVIGGLLERDQVVINPPEELRPSKKVRVRFAAGKTASASSKQESGR
jgi:RND family efflux transporter MFP subunit